MAVNLSPVFGVAGQVFNNNGDPLSGGKIFTYLAGTTTNAATYTSSTGSIAHSNPIILDGAGRVPSGEIWLTDAISYKFVVTDSANNAIGTYDNLFGINSNQVAFTNQQEIQTATPGQTVFTLTTTQYQPGTNSLSVFVNGINQYGPGAQYNYTETNSTTITFNSGLSGGEKVKFTTSQLNSGAAGDACQVGYDPAVPNGVATTVCDKLDEIISVKDYGAVGDGTTDDTTAIQNALNDCAGRTLFFPAGTYIITAPIIASSKSNFAVVGESAQSSTIKCSAGATFASAAVQFLSSTNGKVSNLQFDANNNASLLSNTVAVVLFLSGTQIQFNNNRLVNHTYIGLAINSSSKFEVKNNYIVKTSQAATINYNINVSSTLSVSNFGVVAENYLINSGIGVVGADITISNNVCEGTKYGAGIATFAVGAAGTTPGQFYGRYIVQGNNCLNANGTDVDGFKCCGMEIAGPYSLIQNNTVYNNDGEGIRLFAYQSICSGNIVYNNGKGGAGTYTQAGITAFYSAASAVYSASYSLIQGNRCFDTGGATQLYGYAEQSASLTAMAVANNDLDNNVTAPWLLAATTGNSYDLDTWFSYTPTLTASSGSLTAGTCTGRYMRRGKTVFFQASCAITNNGTGAVSLNITLPINSSSVGVFAVTGRANAISGKMLNGMIIASTNVVNVTDYNASYPGSTGETIVISGWYPSV